MNHPARLTGHHRLVVGLIADDVDPVLDASAAYRQAPAPGLGEGTPFPMRPS
jgi:hypothetical protein